MVATGIVRRIDDLGRVVIPKEIRRTMHIREGEPLEIYTDGDGEVIFKKYSYVNELFILAQKCSDSVCKATGNAVIVTDRENIIAFSGLSKHIFKEKRISSELSELIEDRIKYEYNSGDDRISVADGAGYYVSTLAPVVVNGDAIGCIAVVKPVAEQSAKELKVLPAEQILINTAADFLSRQFDE